MQLRRLTASRTGFRLMLAALPALAVAAPGASAPDSCAAMLCLSGAWQTHARCISAVSQVTTARARGQVVADCDLSSDPTALVTLKWLAERQRLGDRRPTSERPAASQAQPGAPEPGTPSPQPTPPLERAAAIPPPTWEVLASDATLAQTLTRWTRAAGMRLQWDAPRTFLVSGPTVLQGDFETALAALLASPGIRHSDQPLEACIYANTPPLVRITRLGEQARLCGTP